MMDIRNFTDTSSFLVWLSSTYRELAINVFKLSHFSHQCFSASRIFISSADILFVFYNFFVSNSADNKLMILLSPILYIHMLPLTFVGHAPNFLHMN